MKFDDFESAWTDFLIALNSVHSMLEQGAKVSERSKGWYANRKGERKGDPLLAYLHQARNADEHGIEAVTKEVPGGIAIGGPGESFTFNMSSRKDRGGGGMDIQVFPHGGRLPKVWTVDPEIQLVAVRNRGVSYPPPDAHLGEKLADSSPIKVAELGLEWHRSLLEQAAELVE